jgi:transcriptional regulator with XRE-family HTH domain
MVTIYAEGLCMVLAERLRACREAKGLSQRELAKLAGIRHNTISEIERGVRQWITTDVAKKLARNLGVSVDHLIGTWEPDEEGDGVVAPVERAKKR